MFSTYKHSLLTIILLIATLGTLTACVETVSKTVATPTQAQLPMPTSPPEKPNMILDVKRQAGSCPKTIGLWTFRLPFEGGAEHTAVADTRFLAAGSAKLVVSTKKILEYEIPLNGYYVSCIGSAKSETPPVYNFRFQNKKVYFRLDLNKATVGTEITYQGIGGFRPYVRWTAGG